MGKITKAAIFGSQPADINNDTFNQKDYIVIAADNGYYQCQKLNITPDYVLGDFDSAPVPSDVLSVVYPTQKDYTDAMLAVKKALALGCTQLEIYGGLGGRLDHSYANLQALLYIKEKGANGILYDKHHTVQLVHSSNTVKIPKFNGYLSVFAVSETAQGVNISGAQYNVQNEQLTNSFPLGVSNQITDDYAQISCSSGTLLVITATE